VSPESLEVSWRSSQEVDGPRVSYEIHYGLNGLVLQVHDGGSERSGLNFFEPRLHQQGCQIFFSIHRYTTYIKNGGGNIPKYHKVLIKYAKWP
jgi:hypothetical protein